MFGEYNIFKSSLITKLTSTRGSTMGMPDEGEGGAGGGEGEGSGDLEKLQSEIKQLKSDFETVQQAKTQLERQMDDATRELTSPDYLDFAEHRKRGGKGEGEKGGKEEEVGEINDEMTPTQIVKHLLKVYGTDKEKSMGAITKQLSDLESRLSTAFGQMDVVITGQKHKEFGDAMDTPPSQRSPEQKNLVETCYKIAKENPQWSAEKVFKQAKLEIKHENEEKSEAERVKAEKEKKALTEKGGSASCSMEGKGMSKDAAATAAWNATFGNKDRVD